MHVFSAMQCLLSSPPFSLVLSLADPHYDHDITIQSLSSLHLETPFNLLFHIHSSLVCSDFQLGDSQHCIGTKPRIPRCLIQTQTKKHPCSVATPSTPKDMLKKQVWPLSLIDSKSRILISEHFGWHFHAVGNVTGSKEWQESGKKDTQAGIEEMKVRLPYMICVVIGNENFETDRNLKW